MASPHRDDQLGEVDLETATLIMRLQLEDREQLARQDNHLVVRMSQEGHDNTIQQDEALARAIASGLELDPALGTLAPSASQGECLICTDRLHDQNIVILACGDRWCRACVIATFSQAVIEEERFPPKCCDKIEEIDVATVIDVLDEGLVAAFRAKSIEYRTANRVYCSNETCSAFLSPTIVNGADTITCISCQTITCTTCKAPGHRGDCPEDTSAKELRDLAEREGWQICPSCHRIVELVAGCNHITCRCGAHFCYLCQAVWKTCRCKDGTLVRLAWDEIPPLIRIWGPNPNDWDLPFEFVLPLDFELRLARFLQAPPAAPIHGMNRGAVLDHGIHLEFALDPHRQVPPPRFPAPPAPAAAPVPIMRLRGHERLDLPPAPVAVPAPGMLREPALAQDEAHSRVEVPDPPPQDPQVQQANDRPILRVLNRTDCQHPRTQPVRRAMICGECDQHMPAYGHRCRDCNMDLCRACTRGRWYDAGPGPRPGPGSGPQL